MFKVSAPVFIALFFCVAIDIGSQAHATPTSESVRVDDVDRTTDAGATALLRRIERAASEVCGEVVARRYLSVRRAYRECRRHTIAETVDRLGDDKLHAAYVTRHGAS